MRNDYLPVFFPTATIDRGSANGLKLTDLPSGDIIGTYKGAYDKDRLFYLVVKNGNLAFLRIATASPDSGYEAFGVIHEVYPVGSDSALALVEHMNDKVYYTKFDTPTTLQYFLENPSQSIEPR